MNRKQQPFDSTLTQQSMKKSRLQAFVDFISQIHQLQGGKKNTSKNNIQGSLKMLGALIMLFAMLQQSAFAITYYSRTSGNWNAPASWSTVAYGNATNTGSFPQAGDIANIGNGHTIFISNNVSCATLNVG